MSVYIFWVAKLCLSIIILVLLCLEKHLQFFNCLSFLFFEFYSYSIESATQRVLISNILVLFILQYRFEFHNKSSCFKSGRVNFSISPFNLPMHIFPKVISVNLQEDQQIKTSMNVSGLKMKEIYILFLNYVNKWSP